MIPFPAFAPPRPKALIFDWDNTLVDTWPAIHDAINVTLAAFGQPTWTLEETRSRARKSMRDTFPIMFGERWEEAGRVFYGRFESHHLENLRELPGVGEMLAELSAASFFLGVVSNKKGDYLRREAFHLGWDAYLGNLVGAYDAERDKPAPDPVALALSGSGVVPGDEVWFVGDTDIDMECARNAGCIPVLMRNNPPSDGEFGDFPPVLYVEDSRALCKLVTTM